LHLNHRLKATNESGQPLLLPYLATVRKAGQVQLQKLKTLLQNANFTLRITGYSLT
jgi:hypothetical protein